MLLALMILIGSSEKGLMIGLCDIGDMSLFDCDAKKSSSSISTLSSTVQCPVSSVQLRHILLLMPGNDYNICH